MDILPKDISRWTVTKGSIDNNTIKLDAGGTAVVYIEQRDIVELPSNATLQLMVSRFSNGYTPNIYIDITIDTSFHQRINCVDNRGLVHVEIDLPEGPYTNFKIEVFTDVSVEITNMSLIVPTLPLEELLTDIREELPRILSYENRHTFSVGQIETPIGVISLRLIETASINGHLQINFIATEAGTIILRFYTDEAVELYAPLMYRIQPGWNSIGIPHAYLYKTAGLHTMYVTAQVSVGEIIFEPNGVLYTIDGGKLASRTIDVGFDVRDITMRRVDPYDDTSYVFAAGIDEGRALIRGREYSQEYALAWEPISDLGPASDIRIESDGRWVQTARGYRYVTYEYPAATVLRNNGDLEYIDLNGVISPRIIAENVTYHSMVRGYNNVSFEELDQGMLIAYVKDSKAYYRNLLVRNGNVIIQPERRLLEDVTNVTRVNATRLNDYRLAIVVETDNINYLMVTERNWVGMASPAERITTSITDIAFEVTPITYHDTYGDEHIETGITDVWFNVAEPIYPKVLSISNDDEYTIRIKFSHIIDYDLSAVGPAFSVKDSLNTTFDIVSTSAGVDNSELVLTLVNFNGASGNLFVTYDRTIVELDCLNQGSRFAIDSFTYEFTPELKPPEGFAEENLNVAVTDIVFDVTQVRYSDAYDGGENFETSIADISFVVTKVGHDPL